MAETLPASKTASRSRVRPRDAATLLVYEPTPDSSVRILVGRRRADQVFLPGYYVFPGGRVDRQDRAAAGKLKLTVGLDAISFGETGQAPERAAVAHVLAALRETFEETGYLAGPQITDPEALNLLQQGRWAATSAQNISEVLQRTAYICRAITPPGRPRRYDTRFFAIPKVLLTGPHFSGDGELEEVGFLPLSVVWGLQLPSITRMVLADFEAFLPDLLKGAKTPRDGVPFYFQRGKTGQRVLLSRGSVLP